MLIPEISKTDANRIIANNFGVTSGVFLIDKPTGVTSHDVVDDVRKILRTRKVGHAGALDPFAEGVLIVLVGKYTKYTEAFINQDKEYIADVVLGISTDTQDPEGQVLAQKNWDGKVLKPAEINKKLTEAFIPEYDQVVPVFSSVKVQGMKLREVARDSVEISKLAKDRYSFVLMPEKKNKYKAEVLEIEIPKKLVKIYELEVISVNEISEIPELSQKGRYLKIRLRVSCSKGTYIRQLAEDIGEVFDMPAFLTTLQRSKIADFALADTISVSELYELAKTAGLQAKELSELGLRTQGQ